MSEPSQTQQADWQLSGAIEALLIMATEPVSAAELAQALAVPVPHVEALLVELAQFYADTHRGFEPGGATQLAPSTRL